MDNDNTATLPALTFLRLLAAANVERCPDFKAGGLMDWSPAERGNELAGETGELCNELKKLLRFDRQHGIECKEPGRSTAHHFGARVVADRYAILHRARNELGDVIICASLIAAQLGIDLEDATREKFNATSDKIGSTIKL